MDDFNNNIVDENKIDIDSMVEKIQQVEIIFSTMSDVNKSKYLMVQEILRRNTVLIERIRGFQSEISSAIEVTGENNKDTSGNVNKYLDSFQELNNNLNQVLYSNKISF